MQYNNETFIYQAHWNLFDTTGTALDSDSLPTTAPVVEDWDNIQPLMISAGIEVDIGGGDTKEVGAFIISAEVTSVWLIPEPATIFIFALGAMFIRKKT